MNPKIIEKRQGPERIIQNAFNKRLILRKWSVRDTHGSMFQHGFADTYACHIKFGARWIEYKNPNHFVFTPAQLEYFPELNSHGIGVWIIIRDTEDEYLKLFKPQNWYSYLT
jgi:hypothetical protein